MAITLTTSAQKVGEDLSNNFGLRLYAWYSDVSGSSATVHARLEACSQGTDYYGTNKYGYVTLKGTTAGGQYADYMVANTWYTVAETTATYSSGQQISISGSFSSYVYGDASVSPSDTVQMPQLGSAPTGLTISAPYNITPHGATFDVSVTSYGSPSSASGRYIEAAILAQNTYGPTYRFKTVQNTDSSAITVDNTSYSTLVIRPNTQYYYGGYANNTVLFTSKIAGQFVTTAEGPLADIQEKTADSVTIHYSIPADGGFYAKTVSYSLDNGATWTDVATYSGNDPVSGTFTVSGLAYDDTYIILTRTVTAVGATYGSTVVIKLGAGYPFYASVGGVTKAPSKLYGCVLTPQTEYWVVALSNNSGFNNQVFNYRYQQSYGPMHVQPTTLQVSTSGTTKYVDVVFAGGTTKLLFAYSGPYTNQGAIWGFNREPATGNFSSNEVTSYIGESRLITHLYASVNGQTKRIY